jgi:hypothetical protein
MAHDWHMKIVSTVPSKPTDSKNTVFSMIGVNPAAAFNREWQREGILNARFEKLFDLNTTALILKTLGVARWAPSQSGFWIDLRSSGKN